MIPFRVFDQEKRQLWQIINHHQGSDGGQYLAALDGEDPEDDEQGIDGEIRLIPAADIVKYKFVDFIEEVDPYDD